MVEVIGWLSSLLLVATIVQQLRKQWAERSGEGVSIFLYVGQTLASLGFTAYSALVHNWVFTVTNSLLLISAITGWILTAHFKRHPEQQADPQPIVPTMETRLSSSPAIE
jgi:MtN3 and saliva related transmembrane protein